MAKQTLFAFLLSLTISHLSFAVTLNETDLLPDGDFSDDFMAPTPVGAGIDQLLIGRNETEPFDYFVFTDLPAGAQEFTFDFAPADPVGPDEFSYNAGGGLRVDFDGFSNGFDGQFVGQAVLGFNQQTDQLTFQTPGDFDGELFFSFNYTNGENIAFSVAAPSNLGDAVIPLPASVVLLATSMMGLCWVGYRRRLAVPL
ncbi:MAG: hypothetical protein AAFU49_06675 [Pseudomonadota bacterium]